MLDSAAHQNVAASSPAGQADDASTALAMAERRLADIAALAIERHPEAFAAIDADLRRALTAPSRDG